jgi:hypothetical protein
MKPARYLVSATALVLSHTALALGSLANVSVIDRDTGTALPLHYFHGEYWVAGQPGSRYAIEVRNSTGGRLLAVTSVDGINVISGADAGWSQSGYVFAPQEGYQITGWRKSNAEVAAFTFAQSPNSYAALTGRPANIGVIGVALFREQEPEPAVAENAPAAGRFSESPLTQPVPAPTAAGKAESGAAADAAATSPSRSSAPQRAARLGTGAGEREYSYVSNTEFRRLQSEPNEVIRIRYDSRENLIAMGVIRRTRPIATVPNAFPGSQDGQFVPDPPG